MNDISSEIKDGKRFQFGRNWQAFSKTLDEEKIRSAEKSLCSLLQVENLKNRRFLDIGSGSGLFSLVARRLGAQVLSFDYDPLSVACAEELKRRFFPDDPDWTIRTGSVLDKDFLSSLGMFDIVYSWGVLHHTGNMELALANASGLLRKDGTLAIAIYNDQGMVSSFWKAVKTVYCSSLPGRLIVSAIFIPYFAIGMCVRSVLKRKNLFKKERGMTVFYDWLDWLGGLPFEVATPERIFHFFKARGFRLINLITRCGGLGNNEFVFVKE